MMLMMLLSQPRAVDVGVPTFVLVMLLFQLYAEDDDDTTSTSC
jgi:hypothetical protein